MKLFKNDYSEGAAPEILEALIATNQEQCVGYTEGDPHCAHARELIRAACKQDDAMVEFCIGGTSANVICLDGMLHDWEGVICTPDAHINVHETGALGATGRTILTTSDTDGFLTPEAAEKVYVAQTLTGRHMTLPAAIYITDTTELGGVWTRSRFDAICDWAQSHDLGIFLDGARLGSALTAPEFYPEEFGDDVLDLEHIASRVDAFYIGGTKNGFMMGEAVVICGHDKCAERLRESFPYLQKERGGLLAKGRLLGVQFERAFEPAENGDTLYISYARAANKAASTLRSGLVDAGFELYGNSLSNQVFVASDPKKADALVEAVGCEVFYVLDDGRKVIRFVCSWATKDADTEELLAYIKSL